MYLGQFQDIQRKLKVDQEPSMYGNSQNAWYPQEGMTKGNTFVCSEHNEPYTNICLQLNCMETLCPDCIDSHYKAHLQNHQAVEIDSIKKVKFNCVKKVDRAIQSLSQEIKYCEDYFLLNPELIIKEGLESIQRAKEKIFLMVKNIFEQKEQQLVQSVRENVFHPQDFEATFNKINKLIEELELTKYSLEGSNIFQGIQKICRLDLNSLKEKMKTEIQKIVSSRSLDPLKVQVDDQKINSVQAEINKVVQLVKPRSSPPVRIQPEIQAKPLPNSASNSSFHMIEPKDQKISIDLPDYFTSLKAQLPFIQYNESQQNKLLLTNLGDSNTNQTYHEIQIPFKIPEQIQTVILPQGDIYLLGGNNGQNSKSGVIYLFDKAKKELVPQTEQMKDPRSSFGSCTLRKCIYAIGGFGNKNTLLTSCERFNTLSKKWEISAQLSVPCSTFSCTSFNDQYIFKFGGLKQDNTISQVIERYDVIMNRWEQILPQQSTKLLLNMGCAQINKSEILVFGGLGLNFVPENTSFVLSSQEVDQTISPTKSLFSITKVNQSLLPIVEGFSHCQAVVQNKFLYILQDKEQDLIDRTQEEVPNLLIFKGDEWKTIPTIPHKP